MVLKKEEIIEKIAPCSLLCYTCTAFEQGVISELSKKLLNYLEGVNEFYEKHSPHETEHFNIFTQELEKYSNGKCFGCRNKKNHTCSIQGCFIFECVKKHTVDFCGECKEFPCDKTKIIFENEVYLQWLKGNEEIKSIGIEEFWKKRHIQSHYSSYKN